MKEILAVAEKHNLPIVSDEVYADFVSGGGMVNLEGRGGKAAFVRGGCERRV